MERNANFRQGTTITAPMIYGDEAAHHRSLVALANDPSSMGFGMKCDVELHRTDNQRWKQMQRS